MAFQKKYVCPFQVHAFDEGRISSSASAFKPGNRRGLAIAPASEANKLYENKFRTKEEVAKAKGKNEEDDIFMIY